jgi:hypothetical protein
MHDLSPIAPPSRKVGSAPLRVKRSKLPYWRLGGTGAGLDVRETNPEPAKMAARAGGTCARYETNAIGFVRVLELCESN